MIHFLAPPIVQSSHLSCSAGANGLKMSQVTFVARHSSPRWAEAQQVSPTRSERSWVTYSMVVSRVRQDESPNLLVTSEA
jgi:hypothetical protein